MTIESISAGRSLAENLSSRPELRITRPLSADEEKRLWSRYRANLAKKRRNESDENELFEIRRTLGIHDAENAIYCEAIRAEAELAGADEELAAAVREMEESHRAQEELQKANHAQLLKMQRRMEDAKSRSQTATCNHSTTRLKSQQLAGLRSRFYKLFDGTKPGSSQNILPSSLDNQIRACGINPRDMSACK